MRCAMREEQKESKVWPMDRPAADRPTEDDDDEEEERRTGRTEGRGGGAGRGRATSAC